MSGRPVAAILCALWLAVGGCGSRQAEFTVWLNDKVTDLSRAEVTAKLVSGEIDADTLVWAGGKWVALGEHPSAALLLAQAGPAAQRRARGAIPMGPGDVPAGQGTRGPQPTGRGAANPAAAQTPGEGDGPAAPPSLVAPASPTPAAPRGPHDHDNVYKALASQGPDEARALLGEPDAVVVGKDGTAWLYKVSVRGHDGSLKNPELQFRDGKISAVVFWPPATMDEKISNARLAAGRRPWAGTRQRKVTLNEFLAMANGKTKAQILASLGEPTAKRIMQGNEVWQYDDAVEDHGRRWVFAIRFEGDRAAEVRRM